MLQFIIRLSQMSDNPLVTVLCPVYNGINYFDKAIPSILAQSYKNFEFLIIDDGSDDGTAEKLSEIGETDSRIRIISPGRIGFVKALNLGLSEAKGELIARQDFDDVSYSSRIEHQVRYMLANPHIVWSCGFSKSINNIRRTNKIRNLPLDHDGIIKQMLHSLPWDHTLVMFRKNAVLDTGGYPELSDIEDYRLVLNLIKKGGKLGNIAEVLGEHTEHSQSFWNNNFKYKERQKKFRKIQCEIIEELNFPKINYLFVFARWVYVYLPTPLKSLFVNIAEKIK